MQYLLFGKKIKETDDAENPILPNHLIGNEKLNSRQLYSLLVYTHPCTSPSQKYFSELLKTDSWARLVTLDSYSCSLQCKILNNVLSLSFLRLRFFTFHLFVLSAKFLMRQYSIYFTNAI